MGTVTRTNFELLMCLALALLALVSAKNAAALSRDIPRGNFRIYPKYIDHGPVYTTPRVSTRILDGSWDASASVRCRLLRLRGGVIKASATKRPVLPRSSAKAAVPSAAASVAGQFKEAMMKVQPATRYYLYLVGLCTLLHLSGLPVAEIFALDRTRLLDVWRPFTSVAFFGAPSMAMANSIYFLIRYGLELEKLNGFTQHAWFLLVQTGLLSIMGLLLQFPYQAKALVASIVYNSCLIDPYEKIPFQFGMVLDKWQMAHGMMAIDCLSAQSLSAAWPHVMGIISGHAHHYYTSISPKDKIASMFRCPKWFQRLLARFGFGDDGRSNISGLSSSSTSSAGSAKASYRRSLFGRNPILPQPKGRKLSLSTTLSDESAVTAQEETTSTSSAKKSRKRGPKVAVGK